MATGNIGRTGQPGTPGGCRAKHLPLYLYRPGHPDIIRLRQKQAHLRYADFVREEFLDVCVGFLTRAENAPLDIARLIGKMVYDNDLGDIRKARGVWKLMAEPTEDEVLSAIKFMVNYSPANNASHKKRDLKTQAALL